MIDIKSMTLEEITADMTALGEKAFRGRQIYQWMHGKLAEGFAEMTDISEKLRRECEERYTYTLLKPVQVRESVAKDTRKFLFALPDGHFIESVWMKYRHGNSVCVSSQVGCRMGCAFCASAIGGLERSLTAGEMLEQIYAVTRHTGERVANVVVMGMGEPLDNYDTVLKFIKMLTDDNGLHISQRNITVSTCGLVPGIYRLAEEGLQITLAISLHAPTDEQRIGLMPIARKYCLRELMDACGYYFEKTGRRLTFEYSLIRGINDTDQDVEALANLIGHLPCHVNLIPVNPVKERDFVESDERNSNHFKNKLEKYRINVTIRREMGRDIDGACGQLRRRHYEQMLREGSQ